jgi:hypothetical protein
MRLRWAALAMAWLLVGADAPFVPADNAPVKVISAIAYVKRDVHLLCITFVATTRVLSAVTFEISHRRLDDTTSMMTTQQRSGSFSPGVVNRSDAGCVVFPPNSDDAPITIARPIAATFADGSTWRTPDPPAKVTP